MVIEVRRFCFGFLRGILLVEIYGYCGFFDGSFSFYFFKDLLDIIF